MVCTFGDQTDVEWWREEGLALRQLVGRDGRILPVRYGEEGFENIAKTWEAICVAEKNHEKRYLALARNIEAGLVFGRELEQVWYCQNCGYIHEGPEAPKVCPACAHPQAHFCLLAENW